MHYYENLFTRILLISLKSCGYITWKKSCIFQRYSASDSCKVNKNNIKKSVTLFSFDNNLTILLLFFVLLQTFLKKAKETLIIDIFNEKKF